MKKPMYLKATFSFYFLLLFFSISFSQEKELIENFEVNIQLNEDRSISVEENIQVFVLGDKIKRGITRNFPRKRTVNNKKVSVKYKNLEVFKNGIEEPFHDKKIKGENIYFIGDKDIRLAQGTYQYKIKYVVPNQIISENNKSQLLWNAIGTDVIFKIEKAKVKIILQEEMELLDTKMYIGTYGSGEDANRVKKNILDNEIVYTVDGGLSPNEAATVQVDLSVTSVAEPSFFQKYSSLLTLIIGGLLMFFYSIISWFKYGRDPKPDPSSALLYDTPENLSPASLNYIYNEKYKGRAITSSFIALATKGFIKISNLGETSIFSSKSFTIEKLKDASSTLPPEELAIMENLFTDSSLVYLDGEYKSEVKTTQRTHQIALEDQHKAFVKKGNNLKYVLYPFLIFAIAFTLSTILANTIEVNSHPHLIHLAIFIPLGLIGIMIYRYLIIQPTVEKLNLQEEIKSFKQYIEMNANDLSKLNDAPERNISHFESILPFAYALGAEGNWSESFSDVMKQSSYAPSWGGSHYSYGGFHDGLYSSVVSTSYKKPEPGSGDGYSGGGGFSGGGGGGGGVGGW